MTNPLLRYHDEPWHTPLGQSLRLIWAGGQAGLAASLLGAGAAAAVIARGFRPELGAGVALLLSLGALLGVGLATFRQARLEADFFAEEVAREEREIDENPEHERQEIVDIYRDHGFPPDEVEVIARRITSDRRMWLRFMIREELGLDPEQLVPPLRAAGASLVGAAGGAVLGGLPAWVGATGLQAGPGALLGWLGVGLGLAAAALAGMEARVAHGRFWRAAVRLLTHGAGAFTFGYLVAALVTR